MRNLPVLAAVARQLLHQITTRARFGLAAALALMPYFTAQAADSARRPNVVLILADDLGRADVGFMGSKDIKTPHLDALARDGAILDAFYVQPVCSPTRACLMTGRWATRTGVYTIVRPGAPWGLPLTERTLPQALREAGYFTAICGKWHLGEFEEAYRPLHRGFDRQYGHWFGQIDYFTHLRGRVRDWYRDDKPCDDAGYSTHLIAAEACRIVRDKPADKPLFLYVPFNAVHGPHQVPESYCEPYGRLTGVRRTMAGMVSALDEAVGKITAALREKNELENTFIFFASDNGGPEPGRVTDNGPLKAGKGTLYEGGVRVCACVRGPGIRPGTTVREPLHAVDVYPTTIRLAGGAIDDDSARKPPLDGIDATPILRDGGKSPRGALLLVGSSPAAAAVRVGDLKLIRHGDDEAAPPPDGKKAARTRSVELYDLAHDLGETRDLAAERPEQVKELTRQLDALLTGAVPPGGR